MVRFIAKGYVYALALVCMTLLAPAALAQQTNTGTVVGTVTDQSGAVLPGAVVTLTQNSTNSTFKTVSNGSGQYIFPDVPPGIYTLTAVKEGFSTTRVADQTVSVGTQTTISFKMSVGAAAQTIEVQVSGVELQTLNATIGSTIPPQAIASLPSLNHDVNTFTELQPGVSPDGSVAGAVVDQSTFLLDGGNNSSDMDGSMTVYTPSFAGDPTGVANNATGVANPTGVMPTPQDSVEEFKVNTAGQTADFDNSAGAQVEIVTPRGTNHWHGGAYEYYLDNKIDANTWDNNLSGTPTPVYHYSRFGFKAGGFVLPKFAGSRTYLFAMYEGYRFPQTSTYERAVPSAAMRNGMVTFGGTTYDLKALDPRGIGIDPTVQTMWNTYEPIGNDPGCGLIKGQDCDGTNEIGFKANVAIPTKSNFFVTRIDHDFGSKWHWMASYRVYKETRVTTSQIDIGGFFPGDKLGSPVAVSNRPQQPWYFVTGLTTNVTSTTTNDFHYSFLRNYWSWSDKNAPPQAPGLGGALEPFGETATGVLAPFNLDAQDIRTRFWDGHDNFLSDNVTMLKGNHLIQFGGQYQHNWDYHQRTDNGGGINYTTTYQLGDSAGGGLVDFSSLQGAGYPSSTQASRVAAAVYGIVTDSQVAYTRAGSNLALNPPLTPAFDKSSIPFYNVYFSDSWKMKSSLTLTYGLGWTLEMPPTEATGKQIVLVDAADEPIQTEDYLTQRKIQAQNGDVYNPEIGFALVGNVGQGLKYPYNPFYGSFSPRVAVAWNPHFERDSVLGHVLGENSTVVRGGYGRIYGRLNGVDLVLSPLLGVGLIQAVQCRQAFSNGSCGPNNPTVSNAFRVGVDGSSAPLPAASPTLPQPVYPGVNSIAGSASEAMDPHFRPNDIDSFNLSIQRQIGSHSRVEVGYIGRLIHHEYQPVNLNAVPYMISSGGQNFASAYAGVEKALGCATSAAQCGFQVPAAMLNSTTPNPAYGNYINSIASQPFFQAALNSGYCTGTFSNGSGAYANCTAAAIDKELGNFLTQSVWSMFSDMDSGGFTFPRVMMNTAIPGTANGGSGQMTSGVAENASIGYGNYNGGFVSFSTNNWHGITMQQNFTYSKALGTGAVVQASSEYTPNDPFNLRAMYGVQNFNRKFVYNTFLVIEDPWFKEQHGLLGRIGGGWELAPIFTAGSGAPVYCNTQTDGQSFGSGDAANYFDNEQCIFTTPYKGGSSARFNVPGGTDPFGNSVGTATAGSGSAAVNLFKNPVAVYDTVRAPILGLDRLDAGLGPIAGQPYWNVDAELKKNVAIFRQTSFEFTFIATNVFNHDIFYDPTLGVGGGYSPVFGVLSGQGNAPRRMEFGGRITF